MNDKRIIMSIKPKYADLILDGRKTIEFRRRELPFDIDIVYIYATDTVRRIVGAFRWDGQFDGTPEMLWAEHGKAACVTREEALHYFGSCTRGYAIHIAQVWKPAKPFDPRSVCGRKWVAPQSWYYAYRLAGEIPAMFPVKPCPRPADLPPPGEGAKKVRT